MSLLRDPSVAVSPVSAPPVQRRIRVPWRAIREVILVTALFLAYKLGRLAADGHVSEAMTNARTVWDLERAIRLPSESALQDAFLGNRAVLRVANSYYAYVHFPATAAYLIWMYLRRPAHYRWARRALACLTAAALALHVLTPLAPPRMLGMVDTGRLYGPAVYGPPDSNSLANQYAAMPSLHVGWALAVALTLIVATRGRRRWLWLLHPIVTLIVVVVTGNHYWLDVIAAMMLLAAVLLLLPPPGGGGVGRGGLDAAPNGVAVPPPRTAAGRAAGAGGRAFSRCLAGGSRPGPPRTAPPRQR